MQLLLPIVFVLVVVLILIPAAVAGIGSALIEAVTNFDCLSNALPHINATLAEISPLMPAVVMLLAGLATLGLAGWLIVRAVNHSSSGM